MSKDEKPRRIPTGRFSPLRYPGGKGKIARFMRDIVQQNGLSDGLYVEPYAGGAAVAWELLLTGVVRRVAINDISLPVFSFWNAVLNDTDELCRLIQDRPITVDEWDYWKSVFRESETVEPLDLAFAFFYLNRTNRSGILNGGIIGGRNQTGKWKIDARYNKADLIARISRIANLRKRIRVTNLDAVEFMKSGAGTWSEKTLVYVDPPYYDKGKYLYHNSYRPGDHADISAVMNGISNVPWVVSYDDVRPIHDLYPTKSWLQYTLNYSARAKVRGREAMFFSDGLIVPEVPSPLVELFRGASAAHDSFVEVPEREFVEA